MKISVIGCGYLGAVHAAAMAHLGHQTIGIDVDPHKIETLSAGRAPFFEPGFPQLLRSSLDAGKLSFQLAPASDTLADVDVHFIAVGTPQSESGKAANLTYVESALDMILEAIPAEKKAAATPGRPASVIVGKSTVPVGTASRLAERAEQAGAVLLWNPEFLREGFAVQDTLHPDRLVYGLPADPQAAQAGAQALDTVYAPLLAEGIPQIKTNYPTAELVKVAANSFLATKISFINAVSEICEIAGADVVKLADAIGHDERIGRKFLGAGLGFGGGCLPKDIRAFMARAGELGADQALTFLREVDAINMRRRDRVVDLAKNAFDGSLLGHRVTVLGCAFKPNSDDVRDSPALSVAGSLSLAGAAVTVFDPEGMENAKKVFPTLNYAPTADAALKDSELVILATEWQEFRDLDPEAAGELVARRHIIDGRNVLNVDAWRAAGWTVDALGRVLPA